MIFKKISTSSEKWFVDKRDRVYRIDKEGTLDHKSISTFPAGNDIFQHDKHIDANCKDYSAAALNVLKNLYYI